MPDQRRQNEDEDSRPPYVPARFDAWAESRRQAYMAEHSVCVAPIWLSARTPWLAFRMC